MAYRISSANRRTQGEPRRYTWPAILVGVLLMLLGIAMIAYWADFVLRGNMPQGLWTMQNNQYLALHIGAEGLTALLALLGGIGLLVGRGWGMATALVALGGLLYTSINSLAYSLATEPTLTTVFLTVLATVLLSFIALHWSRRY